MVAILLKYGVLIKNITLSTLTFLDHKVSTFVKALLLLYKRCVRSVPFTLTGMWSWFWCQCGGSLGVTVWLGVWSVDWNATRGNQILSIISICNRFWRYFALREKKGTSINDNAGYGWQYPHFHDYYNVRFVTCDGLTPFQAFEVFQESSAIYLWQHFAGNWINLPQLKCTFNTLA